MRITDTAAIITGGASGLGEATARHFRGLGAQVTLLDRDAERGAEVAAEIGALRRDGCDRRGLGRRRHRAARKSAMGRITAAINCAGIATGAKTLGRDGPHPLDAFRRPSTSTSSARSTWPASPPPRWPATRPTRDGARGVIVNTASIAAFDGQKGQAAYAASKGGIAGCRCRWRGICRARASASWPSRRASSPRR